MGFSRYWRRPRELDAERFPAFVAACKDACEDYGEVLAEVVFTPGEVRFEGRPSCETFLIEQASSGRERDGSVFEFCKTEHLPYDRAVEECLKLLKEHFPEVEIPSPS